MSQPTHYLACDLGAESGRVMLGTLQDGRLSLQEIHRFPNRPVGVNGTLRWDVLRIYEELRAGIAKAPLKAESLSTDSWGVDYVWLKDNEPMLTAPFHYRDARTYDYQKHFTTVPADVIFGETGIQFMHLNTLYQLAADAPWLWKCADRFLMIADYFNYLFCGVAKAEESLASTTQLYNPRKHAWSRKLIRAFRFNPRVFPEVVPSGAVLGAYNGMKVIATCSHDTGAAVAAVPASGRGLFEFGHLVAAWRRGEAADHQRQKPAIQFHQRSRLRRQHPVSEKHRRPVDPAGMPSPLGRRRPRVQLPPARRDGPASAAAAFDHPSQRRAFRPARRHAGQDRRVLPRNRSTRTDHARRVHPLRARKPGVVVPAHTRPDRRRDRQADQNPARRRRRQPERANATGRAVVAGPVEATATGNILIQAVALGHLKDLDELRQVVRRSFQLQTFKPQENWDAAYERFQRLTA
jgi:rhamnulokinase